MTSQRQGMPMPRGNGSTLAAAGAAAAPPGAEPFITPIQRFFAGGIAGCIAKTSVAPLDRAKILFQVTDRAFSWQAAWRELRGIVSQEGFRALFKGNSATVLRVLPYSGVQLSSFDIYKLKLLEYSNQPPTGNLSAPLKLCAGSMAGATSVLMTYPLDLLRARMAVQRRVHRYNSIVHAFSTMYKEEGFIVFYRGLGPTIAGILPYAGLSFFTFETLKQIICDRQEKAMTSPLEKLFCGGVAGLVGQSAAYPFDVVRRRMQTSEFLASLHGINTADAAVPVQLVKEDKVVPASSLHHQPPHHRAIPHSSSERHHAGHSDGRKRKFRLLPSQLLAARGASSITVAKEIIATEGLRGLWKGLSMNWVKGPISVAISFTTYDLLKGAMASWCNPRP